MTIQFHRLSVAAVEVLTADSVRIVLAVPEDLREEYRYRAGQHLTVRFEAADESGATTQLRRSYSLCEVPPADGSPPNRLAVAVKRHGPGGFADHAVRKLAAGDTLDVLTPVGGFHAPAGAPAPRRVVGIAAGSGITPVIALLAETLGHDPGASAALLYGNRTAADVMFLDEVCDLKDRFGARFEVLHVLSREDHGTPLLSGRIDRAKLPSLLDAVEAGPQDTYYLCGPFGMVEDARAVLAERGAEHVRFELFDTGGGGKKKPETAPTAAALLDADRADPSQNTAAPFDATRIDATQANATQANVTRANVTRVNVTRVNVRLGGRTTRCELLPRDTSLLAAVMRDRPEVPYACTDGVCGTCRARLTLGTVRMERDYALEPEEKTDGFVLTCQSLPTCAEVSLDFDA